MGVPLWSVVIPIYERRTYLRQCLESVLQQAPGAGRMEILVLDNASPTPGISDLVKDIAGDRVRYHRNERNLGLYGSKNEGIRLTTGRLIHFLHEDDYVFPGFYDSIAPMPYFEVEPAVYHTHYLELREVGQFWGPPIFTDNLDLLQRLVVSNPIQICSVVIDRRVFEKVGYFREDFPHVADWEFWMRSALKFPWFYTPRPLAVFRVHDSQDTACHTASGRTVYDTRRLLEIFEEVLPEDLKKLLPHARALCAHAALYNGIKALSKDGTDQASFYAREASLLLSPLNTGQMTNDGPKECLSQASEGNGHTRRVNIPSYSKHQTVGN